MLLSLLSNLIKLACAFLELKNKSFQYDILEKSRKKQEEFAEEIEKLRSEGTQSSTDRADILFMRLRSEQKFYEYLSAQHFETPKGN